MDPNKNAIVYYDDQFSSTQTDKKQLLKLLFEDQNLTGGGETVSIVLNENGKQAFIYFKEMDAFERVVEKKKITVGSYKFTVTRNSKAAESKAQGPVAKEAVDNTDGPMKMTPKLTPLSYQYRRPIIIDGNNLGVR